MVLGEPPYNRIIMLNHDILSSHYMKVKDDINSTSMGVTLACYKINHRIMYPLPWLRFNCMKDDVNRELARGWFNGV